ncbi:MAG: Triosephosphate isomerase [Candidatus Methanofastidiosum methylothiophilum]|uniref:Triosephosphate isomerase n=1 Tax=Candidatus Methanofastidiosum methylothiophilum TaxID=1705564 RepID=A0A150J0U8_9EURY|nr:MAG: Triosephosphate isomerase [Candidatus Methanofastidiosum methylthiophilus]KYC48018.1 MAG: Triosephosphate isomerase [Candidatus Methanofastidiosum methylthiophilus]KYC50708.1 MAG: Triosephosphate isomerase [Candidatus Methanofastidiosum methylthiophilus]
MKTPIILVNYKIYNEISGSRGLELAKICQEVSKKTGVNIAIAPQMIDLFYIAEKISIPVFSQHVDNIKPGSGTGKTTLEGIRATKAVGTLINHSENRLKIADIENIVTKCKELGLISVVCTNNLAVSKAVAMFNPDFIAVEPPELIGGDISVTDADPDIVKNTVKVIRDISPKTKVLCGAGVKNGKDIKKAIELGAEGVLLASGVTKAKNPREVLEDLAKGAI